MTVDPKDFRERDFDCCTFFLNRVRRNKEECEVYLVSGTRLTGFIRQFDGVGFLFFGGSADQEAREQLLMRHAVSSIVPLS